MERILANIALFRALPVAVLKKLVAAGRMHQVRKGEVLFTEGQPADAVWIVKRGWVSLMKQTPRGGVVTIFTMTPHEALCGISAFDHHGPYSASAVAATDAELFRIPAHVVAELLERYPQFTKALLLTCCERIRHMAEAISVAQAPVEQRLAYTLLRLREAFGNTIPVTHQELARMAGTRWETSIRTLSAMKRKGWLSSSRGRITILKPQPLRALRHNHRS